MPPLEQFWRQCILEAEASFEQHARSLLPAAEIVHAKFTEDEFIQVVVDEDKVAHALRVLPASHRGFRVIITGSHPVTYQ